MSRGERRKNIAQPIKSLVAFFFAIFRD